MILAYCYLGTQKGQAISYEQTVATEIGADVDYFFPILPRDMMMASEQGFASEKFNSGGKYTRKGATPVQSPMAEVMSPVGRK